MWETVVSFNVRSVSSSSNIARSVRWPWGLLILILSLPREHGVGASAAPPPPGDSSNSHASSAAGKIAVEIIGGLLSGVIFVGALYFIFRLAVIVAQPLRFFICHTGGVNQEGKNFPERLYDEMTQSLKLKFFITVFLDRMVLPDGLLFPPQILKELERTQVGIVLVTPDFFTQKWPMVELVNFVESSERPNSTMRRVLPLFYRMTVRQVQDSRRDGVWEGEWRKKSTGGDHPSVERCRHAVRELCKYKGVEYSGSDDDRGRDREYIREILKRVGKIVCEEIWKNNRAKDSVNSLSRGHAPERSGEVIEVAPLYEPEPLSPQPLPIVAPLRPVATPSSSLCDNGHLALDNYHSPQISPPEPKPPSPKPLLTVASPPPVGAPSPNFSNDDHLALDNLPAPHAPPLGPPVTPPPPVIAPSPNFSSDDHFACDIYLAPQTPPHELEPPSPQPLQPPDVVPSPSFFSSLSSSFNSPRRLATRFPRRLRVFISHAGGDNQGRESFPWRLYDEMTQSWKLRLFIRVFMDRRTLRVGLPFAPQILKELHKTQVGIVLVTPDFFTRKWAMVELVNFVESSERPNSTMPRVLPLFYRMTVDQVRNNLRRGVWEGSWTEMSTQGNHPLSVERCRHAVEQLCLITGVNYNGGDLGRDKEYIKEILKRVGEIVYEEIWERNGAR